MQGATLGLRTAELGRSRRRPHSVRSQSFSLAAPIIYVASEVASWPLFTYHPGTNRIDFGWAAPRPNEGPAMYWYGWVATVLVGSSLLGIVATRFARLCARFPLFLVWLLPLLALPILAYGLMPFWTR